MTADPSPPTAEEQAAIRQAVGVADCGGPDRCVNDMCRGYDEGICCRLSDALLDLDDDWFDPAQERLDDEASDWLRGVRAAGGTQ